MIQRAGKRGKEETTPKWGQTEDLLKMSQQTSLFVETNRGISRADAASF